VLPNAPKKLAVRVAGLESCIFCKGSKNRSRQTKLGPRRRSVTQRAKKAGCQGCCRVGSSLAVGKKEVELVVQMIHLLDIVQINIDKTEAVTCLSLEISSHAGSVDNETASFNIHCCIYQQLKELVPLQ
jgi:hypothetical protein